MKILTITSILLAFSLFEGKFDKKIHDDNTRTPRPRATFPPDCPPGWPVQPTLKPYKK